MRIALAIGLTVNILLYTGLTIFLIASETPRPGEKSYLATAFSDHFQNARFSFSPTGYMSLIIDLYLLILPLPAIYKLKLTRAKKFGIFFIFMVGGLGCFASLASLYIRVRINDLFKDPMWNLVSITNFVYVLIWEEPNRQERS